MSLAFVCIYRHIHVTDHNARAEWALRKYLLMEESGKGHQLEKLRLLLFPRVFLLTPQLPGSGRRDFLLR